MPREDKRLQPVAHPQMRTIEVQVYGERNYPLAAGRIPLAMLGNFEPAYEAFRAAHPQYTMERFVRYVFAKGVATAVHAVATGVIPVPKGG